jgi:hypothetical protein
LFVAIWTDMLVENGLNGVYTIAKICVKSSTHFYI